MLFRTGRFLIPALLLSWLAVVGATAASPTDKAPSKVEYKKVKDEAGFFKPETLDKVNAIVKEIKEKYGKDFYVETFPAVSPEHAQEVRGMTQAARDRFFQQWAEERAKIADVDGIYVLVGRDPPGSAIVVSPDLASRFTEQNREQLKPWLPYRGSKYTADERFLKAAKYVEQVLAAPPPAAGGSTNWVLIWFTVGLLGLVGVLMIIRAATSRHPHHPDGHPGAGTTAALPSHHSGIHSVGGGPIGMAGGHALPRLPFRDEDEPDRRMAAGSGQDGLAETQPLSQPEERGRGDEASDR
jgi:hypothetical protein